MIYSWKEFSNIIINKSGERVASLSFLSLLMFCFHCATTGVCTLMGVQSFNSRMTCSKRFTFSV